MGERKVQAQRRHLLLYDGECGFCSRTVRYVLLRDRRGAFTFAALRSAAAAGALAPFGGLPAELSTFYVIENYQSDRPTLRSRASAVFVVAEALGWPWNTARCLRLLPDRWLDAAYDHVARRRHRVFGGADECVVPGPEERGRFLDSGEASVR